VARIRNKLSSWRDWSSELCRIHDIAPADDFHCQLSRLLGEDCRSVLTSPGLAALEVQIEHRKAALSGTTPPFGPLHNGTRTLGRLCYAVCRILRPRTIVETGVAYGVTSAYILQALAENGNGRLHSVDLPPLAIDAEAYVGHLVPLILRERWDLRLGSATEILPLLLGQLETIDVFVHDSLHTYAHMKSEFALALSALRPGGVLIADDVESNRAFEELLGQTAPESWCACWEEGKHAACGALRSKSFGRMANGSEWNG
jgi:predicted O-methyltransferase YrrM